MRQSIEKHLSALTEAREAQAKAQLSAHQAGLFVAYFEKTHHDLMVMHNEEIAATQQEPTQQEHEMNTELYVITNWNQGVASLVEASSKSDAFRHYVLHTDVDMESLDQIEVDFRGDLSNRPYFEAQVELQNICFEDRIVPLSDFADAMIDRWKAAVLDCRKANVDEIQVMAEELGRLTDDNERLRETLGLANKANKCLRDLINEEVKTSERLREERRDWITRLTTRTYWTKQGKHPDAE